MLQRFGVRGEVGKRQDLKTIEHIPLSEPPYFNHELACKVVSYRKSHSRFTSFDELSNIQGFPVEKIDRIKLYLAID